MPSRKGLVTGFLATLVGALLGAGVSACSEPAQSHASPMPTPCTNYTILKPSQPDPYDPPPRYGAAMAYDAVRKQVVLFGGFNDQHDREDTWVWNGSNWRQQYPTDSPPPRAWPAMTFDAKRGVVVLFGGGNPARNDTWTWDGSNWTEQHPAVSPPGDSETPMDYDAALGQVVLVVRPFVAGPQVTQTWAWDGTNWHQLHPAASPDRAGAAMAYDPALKQILLLAHSETWTFDGANWTRRARRGPSKPSQPNMAYDAATRSVVLFDGTGSGATWTWDGAAWTQRCPAASPPALTGTGPTPAMAYDDAARVLVVFGGISPVPLINSSATWTWDGKTWSQWHAQPGTATASPVPTAAPDWRAYVSPRWLYSLAYPPTWSDLPNAPAPNNQHWFSNGIIFGPNTPERGGVSLSISVNLHPDSPCSGRYSPSSGLTAVAEPVTIDGEATTKYIRPNAMSVAVTHNTWCYEFLFNADGGKSFNRNTNDMNAILGSFRFNR